MYKRFKFLVSSLALTGALYAQDLSQDLTNKIAEGQSALDQSLDYPLGQRYNLQAEITKAQAVLVDPSATDLQKQTAFNSLNALLASYNGKTYFDVDEKSLDALKPYYYIRNGAAQAFDDDSSTYYLYKEFTGQAWLEFQVDSTEALTAFSLEQLAGNEDRAVGAVLQGSDDQITYTDLYVIDENVPGENRYELSLNQAYQYYRLIFLDGKMGITSELKAFVKESSVLKLLKSSATFVKSSTKTLSLKDLDVDHAGLADEYFTFTVKTLASNASLQLDGQTLNVGDSFTLKDVSSGLVKVSADGSGLNTSFTFDLQDTLGSSLLDQSFSITIDSDGDSYDDSTELTNGTNPNLRDYPALTPSYLSDLGFKRGLAYSYYFDYYFGSSHGQFPQAATLVSKLEIQRKEEWYSSKFDGYIYIPEDGTYTFAMAVDDIAELSIDGQMILRDEWEAGVFESSVELNLSKGFKRFTYDFYNGRGKSYLGLYWKTPFGEVEPFPKENFFYTEADYQALRATVDFDRDSLTDKQELALGTKLNVADTDGDGILDGAEVSQGTSPLLGDTDDDVVNDYEELNLYKSNPLQADITGFTQLQKIKGSDYTGILGSWSKSGAEVHAKGRRGSLDYEITVPSTDVYRLDLNLKQVKANSLYPEQELVVSIDGKFVQRLKTVLVEGEIITEKVITPSLKAGKHTVKVYWDNVYSKTALGIESLVLYSIDGADANYSGVKDWLEYRLDQTNSFDSIVSSKISPLTVEGQVNYLHNSTATVNSSATELKRGGSKRFYLDVELSPSQAVNVSTSFANGLKNVDQSINWEVTNLFTNDEIALRQGDSLLLNAFPAAKKPYLHWSFDDLTEEQGYSSKINGAVTTSDAHSGQALAFDGLDDQITAEVPVYGKFSVSFWIKPNRVDENWRGYISKWGDNKTDRTFWIGQHKNDGALRFGIYNTANQELALDTPAGTVSNGVWSHITCTYDGDIQKIYVDGVLVATSVSRNASIANKAGIFRVGNVDEVAHHFTNSTIDEVKIFDSALSDDEVLALKEDSVIGLALDNSGIATLSHNGQSYPVNALNNKVIQFNTAGIQTVTANYTGADGQVKSADLTVKVIASSEELQKPWIIKSQVRDYLKNSPLALSNDVTFYSPGMSMVKVDGNRYHITRHEVDEDVQILAKVAGTNQVLKSAPTQAFTVRSAVHNYVTLVEEFEDGSGLVSDTVFTYNLPADIKVSAKVVASGAIFTDGTRFRTLTYPDFSEFGTYVLEILKDVSRLGANCYSVYIDQDGTHVGSASR